MLYRSFIVIQISLLTACCNIASAQDFWGKPVGKHAKLAGSFSLIHFGFGFRTETDLNPDRIGSGINIIDFSAFGYKWPVGKRWLVGFETFITKRSYDGYQVFALLPLHLTHVFGLRVSRGEVHATMEEIPRKRIPKLVELYQNLDYVRFHWFIKFTAIPFGKKASEDVDILSARKYPSLTFEIGNAFAPTPFIIEFQLSAGVELEYVPSSGFDQGAQVAFLVKFRAGLFSGLELKKKNPGKPRRTPNYYLMRLEN